MHAYDAFWFDKFDYPKTVAMKYAHGYLPIIKCVRNFEQLLFEQFTYDVLHDLNLETSISIIFLHRKWSESDLKFPNTTQFLSDYLWNHKS